MPITIKYQPPMSMLSRAAYSAGLGEFAQRQQAMAMQQAAADQDRQMRAQQLAMQAQDRQLARQSQLMDMARARQQDALRQELANREMDLQDRRINIDEMRANAYAEQTRQNDPLQRQVDLFSQKSALSMEKEATSTLAGLGKQSLTPDGQKALAGLQSSWRQLQAMRPGLMPRQYADLVGKWFEKLDRSGIQEMVAPPPTPDELMQQRVFPYDENNLVTFNAKGEPRVQAIHKESKKGEVPLFNQQTGEPLTVQEQFAANPEKGLAAFLKKKAELTTVSESGAPQVPTGEKVWSELSKDHEDFIAGLRGGDKKKKDESPPPAPPSMSGIDPLQYIGEGAFSPAQPPPDQAAVAASILESIPTMEELGSKLKPGMIYRAPDGSIRRKK